MSGALTPSEAAEGLTRALQENADPANVEGMARFGISSVGTLGVSTPVIWRLASQAVRDVGRDAAARHATAALLWESGIHEARVAAAKVDVPHLVTDGQMRAWSLEIDSWDVCDQLCMKCWHLAPGAWEISQGLARAEHVFTKRVGFVLVACFGWKHKELDSEAFEPMLDLIIEQSWDGRNDVKKGINWALRQIGKRDAVGNSLAIATAERILVEKGDSPSARWIARDALRELRGEAVRRRLGLGG